MGGKKKETVQASKKEPPDDSTETLYRAYRRTLQETGALMPKELEEKFQEIRDEKNPGRLIELKLWEQVGCSGVRALAQALKEAEYKFLRSIKFWRSGVEDEGVRSLVQFMLSSPTVINLELVECEITHFGCEFLGNLLSPHVICPLLCLKLDRNPIGNLGVANLATGLRMNSNLNELSLTYCNIDADGGRSILEILIYQESTLNSLNLQGNRLGNQGVTAVLHALQANRALEKLGIADNHFTDEQDVIQELVNMLSNNSTLQVLDLKYNLLSDSIVHYAGEVFRNGNNGVLHELFISENKINSQMMDELRMLLNANKKTKKGKKGGKKKKKK